MRTYGIGEGELYFAYPRDEILLRGTIFECKSLIIDTFLKSGVQGEDHDDDSCWVGRSRSEAQKKWQERTTQHASTSISFVVPYRTVPSHHTAPDFDRLTTPQYSLTLLQLKLHIGFSYSQRPILCQTKTDNTLNRHFHRSWL